MNNQTHRNPLVSSLAALASLSAFSAAMAQTAQTAPVTRVYVVEVAASKDHAFREGVTAWHSCERANGNHSVVLVYDAETGNMGRYAFLDAHAGWAGMDRKNPAGKACAALFRDGVLPNISEASSDVMQANRKITYMPEGDSGPAPLLWVDAFRIKPGQADGFHAGLEKLAAAAAKTHWEASFTGYDVSGSGQGGEDFLLVWPGKDWADVAADPKPSIKDMMSSVYGKSAARVDYRRFFDTVGEQWSDVWSYDKELSVTPEK